MFCDPAYLLPVNGVEINSVNASWVCSKFPERGWNDHEQCFFLYLQQFNRRNPKCSPIESGILTTLCLFSLPANIVAIAKFKSNNLNPRFFLIISAIALANMVWSGLGLMIATTRVLPSWIFGNVGCIAFFTASIVSLCLASWLQVGLSIERLIAVHRLNHDPKRDHNHNHHHQQQQQNQGLVTTLILIVVLFICVLATWAYPYIYLKLAFVKSMEIPIKNLASNVTTLRQVEICTIFSYNIPSGNLAQVCFALVIIIAAPGIAVIVNYSSANRLANFLERTKGGSRRNASPSVGNLEAENAQRFRKSVDFTHFALQRQLSREICLVRLMTTSAGLFFVSNVPIFLALIYIANNDSHRAESSTSLYLSYLNAAINPLCLCFASKLSLLGSQRSSVAVVRVVPSSATVNNTTTTTANQAGSPHNTPYFEDSQYPSEELDQFDENDIRMNTRLRSI